MTFWVYKIFGSGQLLYVGMTSDLPTRISAHRLKAWFPKHPAITWTEKSSKVGAAFLERMLIQKLKPKHNGKIHYKGHVPFDGETWRHFPELTAAPLPLQTELEAA